MKTLMDNNSIINVKSSINLIKKNEKSFQVIKNIFLILTVNCEYNYMCQEPLLILWSINMKIVLLLFRHELK